VNNKPTDYFALLGLPQVFDLDSAQLESNYRKLQVLWHPDRFVSESDNKRRQAVQQTSLINDAFTTLKSPLNRLQHLLELNGIDTAVLKQEELDGNFLFQQMEWRETLQKCGVENNEPGLQALDTEVRSTLSQEQKACVDSLGSGDYSKAKMLFHRLQFLYKLTQDIRALEDRLLEY